MSIPDAKASGVHFCVLRSRDSTKSDTLARRPSIHSINVRTPYNYLEGIQHRASIHTHQGFAPSHAKKCGAATSKASHAIYNNFACCTQRSPKNEEKSK
jgi:hypothetical protein